MDDPAADPAADAAADAVAHPAADRSVAGRAAGDFTDFVRAASGSLLHTAWLLTGDRQRAEDLVQTTLARTYVAWSRVRREDATAYARRVLVNLQTDWWRRRSWWERPIERMPDRPDGDDAPARADQRDALVRALARLGRRERAIVVLRYYADLSENEVAGLLGVTPGAVKSAASRALAKLRVSTELADADDASDADNAGNASDAGNAGGAADAEITTSPGGTR